MFNPKRIKEVKRRFERKRWQAADTFDEQRAKLGTGTRKNLEEIGYDRRLTKQAEQRAILTPNTPPYTRNCP